MKTSILSLLKCFRNLLHKTWIDVVRFNKNQFKWLSKYRIDTVIDIWANIWQFLWEYREILPKANFHSFEPLPSTFQKLKRNFWNNKNVSLYNVWLGRNKSMTMMNECEYDPSSSILEMSEIHKNAYPHTIHSTFDNHYSTISTKSWQSSDSLIIEVLNNDLILKMGNYFSKILFL